MTVDLETVQHGDLSPAQLAALRDLFDREYRVRHGDWDPDRPYGYSSADVHVIATDSSDIVGHVGFQVRSIGVGQLDVLIAGVGGVLVHPEFRSVGLGRQLMQSAYARMLDDTRVLFSYLGCREEVVPFYESAGWSRICVVERCVSRTDRTTIEISTGTPTLIRPIRASLEDWPEGDVDLRGTPW